MTIKKKWFKYFDEERDNKEKQLSFEYGRPLTDEEKEKLLPHGNERVQLMNASLILFSKESDALIAKFYNDADENELTLCIGVPYLFKFTFDLELKAPYYKKCFHRLWKNGFFQTTGICVDMHHVNISWFHNSHYCDPDLNEGKRFYKSWEEIIKGEKEVFEVKSKREPYGVTKSITVPYKEGYKNAIFKVPFEKTPDVVADVDFVVREKLFVTRWKRWFPLFSKAFEVRAKGGPFVESDIEGYREVFSYVMGGDYLTPLDKYETPEEAVTCYIEELHRRLNKG